MLQERTNIFEYQEILMGLRTRFNVSFQGTEEENLVEFGNIWRYAISHLLRWTPAEAEKYLDENIVKLICLDKTLYVLGDKERACFGDYKFALRYAFPDEIKYEFREETIDDYLKVAKLGKYENDKSVAKYPKKFFSNIEGMNRANILLNYLRNTYLSDMSTEQLYSFFADSTKARSWLKKKSLEDPIIKIYMSPLDYLHRAISNKERNNLFYYTEILNKRLKKTIKKN